MYLFTNQRTVMTHSADERELLVPDFDHYPIDHTLSRALKVPGGVQLTWSDGLEHKVPSIWLREFSPDPGTFHSVTREQRISLTDIPADIAAVDLSIDGEGFLQVLWNHQSLKSRYHPGWLRANLTGFNTPAEAIPAIQLWPTGEAFATTWFDGAAIYAGHEHTLQLWLEAIARDGLGLLDGLPVTPDVIPLVPERIGPIRPSNFGQIFEVENLPDANSNAYTAIALAVHSDLATREYIPGLQFLFCLVNEATGGDSILADGFSIAAQLRDESEEFYEVLATQDVPFGTKDKKYDHRHSAPILEHNANGELLTIRHTYWLRSPMQASFDTLNTFYAAYRRFQEIANDPANQLCLRLQSGQMMAFDNRRILHGRKAFDPSSGHRLLRGCYGEREELASRLRILYRQQRQRRIAENN